MLKCVNQNTLVDHFEYETFEVCDAHHVLSLILCNPL